ncbi:MAG TPA: TerC family protein [Bryobacteraceae bacterium]|nr:TerC family protein [Bryobacteraceae bacterium]
MTAQNHIPWQLLFNLLTIVIINLVLSGDNAVVIALAAKTLPRAMRLRALTAGAGSAVVIRVVVTFFAAELLHVEFVQLAGGILIFWICVNLFREAEAETAAETRLPSFWRAMWFILVADVTMSTDNILAIAAVAEGSTWLLIFGLGLSIPLVIFASNLLANLMDKYPLIIYLGAALLGRVAAAMILTDAIIVRTLAPSPMVRGILEAAAAGGVLVVGRLLQRRRTPVSSQSSIHGTGKPR